MEWGEAAGNKNKIGNPKTNSKMKDKPKCLSIPPCPRPIFPEVLSD